MPGQGRELFHQAHYNVLAKRIRELRGEFPITAETAATPIGWANSGANTACDRLVEELSKWFAEDNPRFKPELWRDATSL